MITSVNNGQVKNIIQLNQKTKARREPGSYTHLAYLQINEDAENVLEVINEFAGVLPFDDKASPEVIQRCV